MKQFFLAPFSDLTAAFARALPHPPWRGLVAVFVGFVVSGWVYVPIHELLHAFGCVVTGGTVTRLEIDPHYGAALLREVFPFIAVGSDYAGQLTDFDTHGNDLIYLATVFAPFLLTILFGVALLRAVARVRRPGWGPCLLIGVATPQALAPFANALGDYYEMGSIIISRVVVLLDPGLVLEARRSDDLVKTTFELFGGDPVRIGDLAVWSLGALLGFLLAFATYWAGGLVSDLLVRRGAVRE